MVSKTRTKAVAPVVPSGVVTVADMDVRQAAAAAGVVFNIRSLDLTSPEGQTAAVQGHAAAAVHAKNVNAAARDSLATVLAIIWDNGIKKPGRSMAPTEYVDNAGNVFRIKSAHAEVRGWIHAALGGDDTPESVKKGRSNVANYLSAARWFAVLAGDRKFGKVDGRKALIPTLPTPDSVLLVEEAKRYNDAAALAWKIATGRADAPKVKTPDSDPDNGPDNGPDSDPDSDPIATTETMVRDALRDIASKIGGIESALESDADYIADKATRSLASALLRRVEEVTARVSA